MPNLNLNNEEVKYLLSLLNNKIGSINRNREIYEAFMERIDNSEVDKKVVSSYYEKEFIKDEKIYKIFHKLLAIERTRCLKEKK